MKLVLLAALLVALIRVVIERAAHIGALECAVVAVVGATLVAFLLTGVRRAA